MVSIEDPFDQDDWDGYRPFTAACGDKATATGKNAVWFPGAPAVVFLLVLRCGPGNIMEYRRLKNEEYQIDTSLAVETS